MALIFISYRRDDTSGHAGRIYDHLSRHFAADDVFLDVDSLVPGENWLTLLSARISEAKVLIVLIGKRWRIEQLSEKEDYVREEIVMAWTRGLTIIPVLVEGAQHPRAEALPEAVKDLAFLQAVTLSPANNTAYLQSLDELIASVETALQKPLKPRKLAQTTTITIVRKGNQLERWELVGHGLPEVRFGPDGTTFQVTPGRYSFYVYYRHGVHLYGGGKTIFVGTSERWEGVLASGHYCFECGPNSSSVVDIVLGFIPLRPVKERLYLKQVSYSPWVKAS